MNRNGPSHEFAQPAGTTPSRPRGTSIAVVMLLFVGLGYLASSFFDRTQSVALVTVALKLESNSLRIPTPDGSHIPKRRLYLLDQPPDIQIPTGTPNPVVGKQVGGRTAAIRAPPSPTGSVEIPRSSWLNSTMTSEYTLPSSINLTPGGADPTCPPNSPVNLFPADPLQYYRRAAPSQSDGSTSTRTPKRRMTVVFFMNYIYLHGPCLSLATALHHGFDVRLIGFGKKQHPKRPRRIPQLLQTHLESYPPDELLMIADGGDTHFLGGPDELYEAVERIANRNGMTMEQFQRSGLSIVSAESLLNEGDADPYGFPRNFTLEREFRFSPFPNTGVYVGYKDSLLKTLAFVYDMGHYPIHRIDMRRGKQDQVLFDRLWKPLRMGTRFLLDHFSDISHTMLSNDSWTVHPGMFEEGKVPKCPAPSNWCEEPIPVLRSNRLQGGTVPVLLHWNGGAKFRLPEYVRCYHMKPVNLLAIDERSKAPIGVIRRNWLWDSTLSSTIHSENSTRLLFSNLCPLATRLSVCSKFRCI